MKLKVVMFTDRQGSTEGAVLRGDKNREALNFWQQKITEAASHSGGTIVKFLGDGHLITFDSVFNAVRAGKFLQDQAALHNKCHPAHEHLHIRVGIDAGDVSVNSTDNDVVGHAVDLAKRVESAGQAGEVILSDRAHTLLRHGYVTCEPFGAPIILKGETKQSQLWRVRSCESEDFEPREHLSKYLSTTFLQVLVREFSLHNSEGRRHITIEVNRDLEVVTTTEEKHAVSKELSTQIEAAENLSEQLARILANQGHSHTVIDCKKWPLRYANGGVLPIVETQGQKYFCLFYRERFPQGWNIANGASDSVDEMLDPLRIVRREFGEELLVVDSNKRIVFGHDPGVENKSVGYQREAISAWSVRCPARGYKDYRLEEFPSDIIKWVPGPDKLTAVVPGFKEPQVKTTDGVFINILPADNSIEIDQIVELKAEPHITFLDGELSNDGEPLGRIVGLFNVSSVKSAIGEHKFKPDRLFFDGLERDPHELDRCIEDYYGRLPKPDEPPKILKFDLCPITRELVTRYLVSGANSDFLNRVHRA